MRTDHFDLAIVGSGSAASSAAIHASESGARVAMVERGTVGGTCVNVGCIASKAELAAAAPRHRAAHNPFPGGALLLRLRNPRWLSSTCSMRNCSTSRGWSRSPTRPKVLWSEAETAPSPGLRSWAPLHWTLFEQPGGLVCAMSPTLRIDTSDGAKLNAHGRGFAARARQEESEWRVAATLRFQTDDARYAWLDGLLGLWEGEFDAEGHRARYRAYLQRTDDGRESA